MNCGDTSVYFLFRLYFPRDDVFCFAQEAQILLVCSMLYVKPGTISIFNKS